MKTPIYDALQAYADRQPIRFHMPGHKGHAAIPAWNPLYALDITEISGADSLLEADGIIAESSPQLFKRLHPAGLNRQVGISGNQ